MNSVVRTVLFWAVIVVSAFLLWQVVRSGSSAQPVPEISHSDFLSRIASGQVGRVIISGQGWPNWILNLVPLILLAALWFFMIRQMQKRNSASSGPPTYTPPQESKPRFGP